MARGDRIILGTRKGLFVLERDGGRWRVARRAHPGQPVVYAFHDARNGYLFSSLEHGHWGSKLTRSPDWGATIEELTPPKYPEGAEEKPGKKAALGLLWTIAPGHASEPGRLYAGTVPGGLFASDDAGASWTLDVGLWNHPSRSPELWFSGGIDKGPGIHSVIVDPRDARRILVGISCAGVFETRDGGASWAPRNKGLRAEFLPEAGREHEVGHDPHFVAAAPSDPDVLWQQNHCGIFRSEDGAASWTEIGKKGEAAHFGFAIAADARDPRRAWVVPQRSDEERNAIDGKLVACRTDDGGKSWRTLTQGLPQEDAYDVVYRHALDAAGDRVAFGSTTGNVYVSDDAGERWTSVGNHFPPVYSVRFA